MDEITSLAGRTVRQSWHVLAINLLEERARWILWVPVLFGAGIGAYFLLPDEPPLWLGLSGVVASGVGAWFIRGNGAAALLLGLLIGLAGFSVAQWRTVSLDHPVLEKRLGPTMIEGQIRRVEPFPNSVRITLASIRIQSLTVDKQPPRVRLKLRGRQPAVAPGDWVRVRAIISPPPDPAYPGSFDLQRQFYFQQLSAIGFSVGPAIVTAASADQVSPGLYVERLRLRLTDRIMSAIDGEAGAVAAALMTGHRTVIPEPILEDFRRSGISHLLAISGLHIGLVAGIIFIGIRSLLSLFRRVALNYPVKKFAAVIAVLAAFAYALIAGATVPTQRAFLMISLVLIAVLVDRQGISMRMVAWAAMIILALTPEVILGPSFQMSFGAVMALIAAYEWLSRHRLGRPRRDYWWRRGALYIGGVVLTTIVAGAATGPFVLYHFNRIAVFGMAANLIAVPLTAFWIMPAAVLSFLAMPLGLEAIPLAAMAWGAEKLISIAHVAAHWPASSLSVPAVPLIAVIVVTMGGLWLCLWQRRWRLAGIPLGMAGIALMFTASPPDIIVDGEGRLFGVRQLDGGYILSSRSRARFTGKVWLRTVGQGDAKPHPWPRTGSGSANTGSHTGSQAPLIRCDTLGCIVRKAGYVIALIENPLAAPEDCGIADAVIATVPVPRRRCRTPALVIDRFDLWRFGSHAVWIGGDGLRVENVKTYQGNRPWVIQRGRQPVRGPGRAPAGG